MRWYWLETLLKWRSPDSWLVDLAEGLGEARPLRFVIGSARVCRVGFGSSERGIPGDWRRAATPWLRAAAKDELCTKETRREVGRSCGAYSFTRTSESARQGIDINRLRTASQDLGEGGLRTTCPDVQIIAHTKGVVIPQTVPPFSFLRIVY